MKIKTYTDNDIFPSNCWFADWQPAELKKGGKAYFNGEVVIRKRDEYSTLSLITLPVGKRGMTKSQAEKLAGMIVGELGE